MKLQDNVIIESLGIYLPEQTLATADVLAGCIKKIHFPLEKMTGIKSRHISGQDEFSINLAKNAINDCFSKSRYSSTDIDILICCNISRYDAPGFLSFEPCTSVKLRHHLGFTNALIFDITNACAGMFTGIFIINALINNGTIRRGMVVSGEYITFLTNTAQQTIDSFMDPQLASLTLGDAGAALILEKGVGNGTGFQEFDLQTFGEYSQYCIAKSAGRVGMAMYTDSMNLTEVAVKSGARHALDLLQRAEWSPESFQHLIMHQTSSLTLNSAKKEINRLLKKNICHDGNTINNLEHRGNTASTAHFIALSDNIVNNNINSGDKILFSISASGLTIGTALYIFDDLPDRIRNVQSGLCSSEKIKSSETVNSGTFSMADRIRVESTGICSVIAIENTNSMELLKAAAKKCLSKSSYHYSEIGLLIYVGVYRSEYVMEPAYAALLAGELGLNATFSGTYTNKTLAFDIFNGAMGFLNACFVAQQMIVAGNCKTAMIVAAEIDNNKGRYTSESPGILEMASAIILDSQSPHDQGFSSFHFDFHPESINAYNSFYSVGDNDPYLHIYKAGNIETLYIEEIVAAIRILLENQQLDIGDIDIIFPPQISTAFIKRLRVTLDIPGWQFIDITTADGDYFSSSLSSAFEHAREMGIVNHGDTCLMIAVGSGLQVGCAVYHF